MELKYHLREKEATKIFLWLIIIELAFCAIHFADFLFNEPSWRIHSLFNLDGECNIPSWFSTIQLFMIGATALLTARSQNYTPPPSKKSFTILGLGFIYLSIDEGSLIHEKLTYQFYNNPLVPYFHGTRGIWIVVYGAIGIVLLLVLWRDMWDFYKNFRKEAVIFTIGMIVYLAGTGGAETITFFFLDKTNQLVYTIEVLVEEFLEMLGASILFYSILLTSIKKTTIAGSSGSTP